VGIILHVATIMKKHIVTILLILTAFFNLRSFGQKIDESSKKEKYSLTDFGDTFVAKISLTSNILYKGTSCSLLRQGTYCLYQGIIEEIYFMPHEKPLFDSVELRNNKYFVIIDTLHLDSGKFYTVSLRPGSNKRYLVVNRKLNIQDPNLYTFENASVYLSGVTNCYDIGIFNRTLEKIGLLDPQKINYKNKKLKPDQFDLFIKKIAN
jgi:hypothetical protein